MSRFFESQKDQIFFKPYMILFGHCWLFLSEIYTPYLNEEWAQSLWYMETSIISNQIKTNKSIQIFRQSDLKRVVCQNVSSL